MGLIGGKSGGKNALAAKPNLLNALRVQTSSYGQVIPIVYGQNRISGRLLWSGDFTSIPHTATQKVGGKGLGSGGGNVSQTTYTYQTAVAIALCMGPIQNMYNVWDTKGRLTLVSSSVQYTVPGGGGSFGVTPPSGGIFHSPRGVSRADAYNFQVNDFGSDGSATLAGTQQTPMLLVSGTPGGGQYSLSGSSFTFSAADAGKTMTINYVYSVPDSNSNGQPQQKLNLTLFLGSRPQTPWTYLTSRHPGQDLGYNGIAYIASSALDLGDSGALPNLSYEVLGILPFGGGIADAEPSAIINDLLSNPYYGLAGVVPLDANTVFNNAFSFKNFCIANGLFVSPVLDAQKSAAQWIQDLLDITNSAAVWSEGLLKIIPYGDTTAVGNGAIFIPNTAPVYDLSSNDFLDVVTVKRPSIADVMNSVSVEFANRANDYNPEVAEDKDEAMIGIYGLRKAQPVQAHSITTTSVAKQVANFMRKRQVEIRATYTLKLGWQFNLLEPMDLVTLTIPELGYSKKPVRITAIREDDTGQLEIDAEDFPWATATATLYPQQAPTAFVPNINADPGNVNAPVVFEAPFQLSRTGSHEIWIAVSGASANWGGCSVWLSQDNTEYHQIGKIYAPARMGTISASVAAGSDPDTTNFFPVDLTESAAILSGGTQADADSYRTLCYADGEFMAYRDVNLTGSSKYNVGQNSGAVVYVRRGLFGTQNVAHNAGAPFVRLDDAIFTYVYDPTFIGKTIYLKFTSFNTNGMVEQSIANPNVAAYQFLLLGKYCQSESISKNLLSNPGFESNQSVTPILAGIASMQRVSDGWRASGFGFGGYDTSHFAVMYEDTTFSGPRSGSRCANVQLVPGPVLNNAANFTYGSVQSDMVPVNPGETYSWGGYIAVQNGGVTFPAGCSTYCDYRLLLYAADGTYLSWFGLGVPGVTGTGFVTSANSNQGYIKQCCYMAIPQSVSGRTPAFATVQCTASWTNQANGSSMQLTAGQFVNHRFDDVWLFPQWLPTGDEIGKQGSMSNTYVGGLTYTNNASSITWSWSINAQRTDSALSVNSYSGSQAVTGLSAATSYNFYPFIDEINQVVSMVATGGVGSPSWAHSGTAVAWAAEQDRGDHYPLSSQPVAAATTSSGTGSGGSGGGIGGACLRSDVRVCERTKGVIPVSELAAGDFVQCPCDDDTPEGWVEVAEVEKRFLGHEWVHTFFNVGDWLATTPGHPFTLHDGTRKLAAQLCFEDAVPCTTGVTFPKNHALHRYGYDKVSVTVRSKRHVFYAGMNRPVILQHNFIPQS